jgi:Ca2+-binding RTX toxin-like protein
MTGGGGRDTWDFNEVADSPAGATRDMVTDFAPGQDILDIASTDADAAPRPYGASGRHAGAALSP